MESHGPELHLSKWRLVFFPSLGSLQPKWCAKIWHDKKGENETIPIWNLIVTLAENSGSQWSRFSGTPSVRSSGKAFHIAQNFSPKHNLPTRVRASSSLTVLFWAIPRNNKYTKKPQNLITLDFFVCREHGSRTNIKENRQHNKWCNKTISEWLFHG